MEKQNEINKNWSLYYREIYEPQIKRLKKRCDDLYDENKRMKIRLEKYEKSNEWFCIIIKRIKMSKEKGRQWDGKSRVSNETYRKRWNEIFDPSGLPKNFTDKYTDSSNEEDKEKKEK